MILLEAGQSTLEIDPALGGSIVSARWGSVDMMRPARDGGVLGASSFPLVPYSNRISGSAFEWRGEHIALRPNHPGDPDCPAIHGVGWSSEWAVAERDVSSAMLELLHSADRDWPWSFRARQQFNLLPDGIELSLSIENISDSAMPAGLGFHPFFPLTERTIYRGLHLGEWATDDRCIPTQLASAAEPRDWWQGEPVASRNVDTVYTGREGELEIDWPERGIGLRMRPSDGLQFTTVYVPEGEDFFCVEPVSHMTDAFNRDGGDSGMRVLEPIEEWSVALGFDFLIL